MKTVYHSLIALFSFLNIPGYLMAAENETIPFVMQLTRSGENYGHRKAFMQIDKVLNDIGESKLKIEVVAYEDGIHALLASNKKM